ncbi:Uu.00g092870.m01.CDS01 [Anthostomella pinea]|uniref:Uu.00g092870.m01.CDS01 n=1 Tax=Anthostomella pinea TaxID=933095 RepID=A0AAI8YKD9_9PEZI|nr:Uu.00g092870.m01.CDS01 [Anthostomella pinea]
MLVSILLAAALGASSIVAAPTWPSLNWDAAKPDGLETVSEYFNMLALKVEAGKQLSSAPVCDMSKAVMPVAPKPLATPTAGLTLKHVAIGRGTQNYTCDLSNATAVPAQLGAVATLFNASCVAATYPDLLHLLPKLALQFNLTQSEVAEAERMGPTNLIISGRHFFTNTTTPFFDLDVSAQYQLGAAPCSKDATADAPADAPKGQQGEGAVAWLRLLTRVGATGDLQEVYRVETAGGSAPKTCVGMPASFEVQYAAQRILVLRRSGPDSDADDIMSLTVHRPRVNLTASTQINKLHKAQRIYHEQTRMLYV